MGHEPEHVRDRRLVTPQADGRHEREIVKREGARHVHWPRWSADGRYVYFNSSFQNGNLEPTEIFRVRTDGGGPEVVIATARRAVFPLPTPDGRSLLYAGNPDGAELNLRLRDMTKRILHRILDGDDMPRGLGRRH